MTRGGAVAIALLSPWVGACLIPVIDLDRGACDDAHRCPEGYVCGLSVCVPAGPSTDGGAADGGTTGLACPEEDPTVSACQGHDWFIAPGGSPTADGTSAATARDWVDGLSLAPGDTIHALAGVYTVDETLKSSGTGGCPLVLLGDADGGTVWHGELSLDFETVHIVVKDINFVGGGAKPSLSAQSSNVVIDHCSFRPDPSASGTDLDFYLGFCADCTVERCTFVTVPGRVPLKTLNGGSDRTLFRGNTVQVSNDAQVFMGGLNSVIEGNDFTGTCNSALASSSGSVVTHNVFHGLVCDDTQQGGLLTGAGEVSHNTFANIAIGQPIVSSTLNVHDNIFTQVDDATDATIAEGGYNLFDPSVGRPYRDSVDGGVGPTDLVAPVAFDPSTFTPVAGSAAIDHASPSSPVPLGGGARADIGAVERGAPVTDDGRLCTPDGGLF